VVIDGNAGVVLVDPSPIILEEYRFRQRQDVLERERLARLRHTPAITLDGQKVELLANIEQPGDAGAAVHAGAAGVGLFRSEFLFMGREGKLPGEEEQFEAYKAAVQGMQGLPVTIRTIDVGADKPLDKVSRDISLNPALGLRAIRWSLAEPAMFRTQLRAILRAAALGPVQLLFPMVSHQHEVHSIVQQVRLAQSELEARGVAQGPVQLGAMIEIPAAAIMVRSLLQHFDFVSIGTNDLIQYTLAIDRADESVAHLYDPLHPAVLQLVAQTIAECNAQGRGVSVCGEMAGDTSLTRLLLGLGLRSFSMHPAQILAVKQEVLRADVRLLEPGRREALRLPLVQASLSPASVWRLGFEQLLIDSPVLDVRRTPDGRIEVAGLDMASGPESDGSAADWFFNQSEFIIRQGTVRWIDDLKRQPPLALSQLDFVVRNGIHRHDFRLDATPPADWGERLSLRGQLREPLIQLQATQPGQLPWRDWSGEVFADFPHVDVARLRAYADLSRWDVQVRSGRGALRAWADVERGKVHGVTAQMDLEAVDTTLGKDLPALALDTLTGRLELQWGDEGFEVATDDLRFRTRITDCP